MNSAVIVFPGSNRERDMAHAIRLVTGEAPALVWHAETELPAGVDLVVLPGGFSYGDYLRCGAIAARSPVMAAVRAHAARGGLVLGVCNGFQILCEAGLLPGVLMRNASLRFVCRQVPLVVENVETPFTSAFDLAEEIAFPIAHGDGNWIAGSEVLARVEDEGRVAFRYARHGNPNGALNDIAGILDASGRVLGLMPHPENAVEPLQGGLDGRRLFESLAAAV